MVMRVRKREIREDERIIRRRKRRETKGGRSFGKASSQEDKSYEEANLLVMISNDKSLIQFLAQGNLTSP